MGSLSTELLVFIVLLLMTSSIGIAFLRETRREYKLFSWYGDVEEKMKKEEIARQRKLK